MASPTRPIRFEDFKILPGTFEALNSLKNSGFALAVVTNQPDVGNGKVKKEIVAQMNADLISKLPIDIVKVCYHRQTDGCNCRKPEPGLNFIGRSRNASRPFQKLHDWR